MRTTKRENYFKQLAKKNGLPFVRLTQQRDESNLLKLEERYNYLQLQAIPIAIANKLTIATSNPSLENQEKIVAFFSQKYHKKIKLLVITQDDLTTILANTFK
ncbi:MAG TPA: hypothetical protein VHD33_05880, partial [Legionellaceae bacterium]|nr:hypothetical protein [Legionellaceae bacterium]